MVSLARQKVRGGGAEAQGNHDGWPDPQLQDAFGRNDGGHCFKLEP